MAFVHLNLHSCYSLLAGTMKPEDIPPLARRRGFTSLALTDTDGLYAAIPFQRACEREGLHPVLGVELTRPRLRRGNGDPAAVREPGGFARERPAGPGDIRHRATLLARNDDGYRLLGEIITARHRDDRFSLEDALAQALSSGDIHVITAGEGLLRTLVSRAAVQVAGAGFPPRLFAELRIGPGAADLIRQQSLLRLAGELDLPAVATGGVFFARRSDLHLHQLLSAMRNGRTASSMPSNEAAPGSAWLMDEKTFRETAGIPPLELGVNSLVTGSERCRVKVMIDTRLPTAINLTAAIAADCNTGIPIGKPRPPRFELPQGATGRPQNPDSFLYRLAHEGLRERLGLASGDRDRQARRSLAMLRRELHVIRRRGVSAYFLIAWDLVRYGRSRRLASLGRGSAAGSLVSFALGITHVNPLDHQLYFERFLNLERQGLPDFDIDFGSEARHEILDYAFARYGRERVAMIGTYQTFRPRGAIRGLVAALGLGEEALKPFIESLPRWGSCVGLRQRLREDPAARHLDLTADPLPELLDLAERLDGLPRHLGTHPCGIVIAPGPITDFVPLQRGAQGLAITQWDMHSVEAAGLVKMDILGQRGLAVIDATAAAVRRNHGTAPRLAGNPPLRIGSRRGRGGAPLGEEAGAINPFTDRKTGELLSRGRSQGCFYIESPIMMQIMKQSRCRDFETLTALSSIIRPGVSNHGGKRSYLLRHLGREQVAVPHQLLEPVLRDTYGCLIYQEQVMRVLQVVGGMTLGEADGFRKTMSGKGGDSEVDFRERFMAGALVRLAAADGAGSPVVGEAAAAAGERPAHATATAPGSGNLSSTTTSGEGETDNEAIAAEIYRQVASFAGYAFCKAHSASFARESFESAWWKAHHPAEFMAAVIEERGGYYSTAEYVEESRRLGLEILPPHVNSGTVRTRGFGADVVWRDSAGDGGSLPAPVGKKGAMVPDGDGGATAPGSGRRATVSGIEPAVSTAGSQGRLRVGLSFVRGIRSAAVAWVAEEGRRRPFSDLREIIDRARCDGPDAPRRYELARLIRVGALEGLPVGGLSRGGPHLDKLSVTGHLSGGLRHQATRPEQLEALARLWPPTGTAAANVDAFRHLNWPTPAVSPGKQGALVPAGHGPVLPDDNRVPVGGGSATVTDGRHPTAAGATAIQSGLLRARATCELEQLGFTPSAHPLLLCRELANTRRGCITAWELDQMAWRLTADAEETELGRVKLVGVKVSSKRTRSGKDNRLMAFYTFSDETGNFEAIFYPGSYARLARRLRGQGPFRITGEATGELGQALVTVTEVENIGGSHR